MSHQTKWYPYLNKEDTAKPGNTLFSHQQPEPGTIIVCQELEYRSYAKFPSYSNFGICLFGTKTTHRCFYEVIIGGQCPYIDFDALTAGHDENPDEIEAYDDPVSTRSKDGTNYATVLPIQRKIVEAPINEGNFGRNDTQPVCATVPEPYHKTKYAPPKMTDMGTTIRDQVLRLSGLSTMPTPTHPTGITMSDALTLTSTDKVPSPTNATTTYKTTPPVKKTPKLVLTPEEAKEAILALKQAIMTTCDLIKDENILIFSSHSNKKQSFHIKVDGWCFPDHLENKAFMQAVVKNYPEKWRSAIDMSMYKTIQQFRVYGCHKWGQNQRIKVFRPDLCSWRLPVEPYDNDHEFGLYLLGSLVTNIGSCIPLPSFIPKEEQKFKIRSAENPEIELTPKDVEMVINTACKIAGVTFAHFPYKVDRVKGGLITLKRLNASFCRVCDREHEHENPCIYVVGTERHLYFDCRRNEDGRKTYLGNLGYAVPDVIVPGTSMEAIMAMMTTYTHVSPVNTPPLPVDQVTTETPAPVKVLAPATAVPRTPSPVKHAVVIPIPLTIQTKKVVPVMKHISSDLNCRILAMRAMSERACQIPTTY
jgi:hypothetical protein